MMEKNKQDLIIDLTFSVIGNIAYIAFYILIMYLLLNDIKSMSNNNLDVTSYIMLGLVILEHSLITGYYLLSSIHNTIDYYKALKNKI